MNADGQLPPKWEWATLGDICEVRRDQVNPQEKPNEKLNYLSIENIESNSGDLVNFVPTIGRDIKSPKLVFTTKDVLYSKLRPYLNKVHVPTFDGISATDLIPIRPLGGIPREYIAYFLRARQTVDYANYKIRGIQLPRLPVDELLALPVPVAPLPEQGRIITKLQSLFREIKIAKSALDKVPPLLRRFRQSVLAAAFRGGLTERDSNEEPAPVLLERIRHERRWRWEEHLRAKGKDPKKYKYKEPELVRAEELPELPSSWIWARLGELIESMKNGLYKRAQFYGHGTPCLRMYNIEDGKIVWKDVKEMKLSKDEVEEYGLNVGDILLNRVNSRELVGKAAVIPAGLGKLVFESKNIRVRVWKGFMEPKYVSFFLQTGHARGQIELECKQTVGMATVSQQDINEWLIPLCSSNEQKRLVSRIEELFARANQVEKAVEVTLNNSSMLEQSILARAFRGELVPQDPDDEPASVLLERIKAQRVETVRGGKFSSPRQTLLETARTNFSTTTSSLFWE